MSKLRKYLKDHPIQYILTALVSLTTIIGFIFFVKSEYDKNSNETTEVNDYVKLEEYDSSDKSIISFLEYKINGVVGKMEYASRMRGAIEVKKNKTFIYHLPTKKEDLEFIEEENFINKLSIKDIIKTREISNNYIGESYYKKIEITTGKNGKKYLIGETTDYIYFTTFDLTDIQIMDKKIDGDTIFISFKIGKISSKTPIYDLLDDNIKEDIQEKIKTIFKLKLLLKNKQLSIIDE